MPHPASDGGAARRFNRLIVSPIIVFKATRQPDHLLIYGAGDRLPFVLPGVLTIDPRADDKVISAAADELVKGVLDDETRVVAASMTMEEIFDRVGADSFKRTVLTSVQLKLDQFGVIIYDNTNANANMKQPGDGHFSYLGLQLEAKAPTNGEFGAMEPEWMALQKQNMEVEAEVQLLKNKRDAEAGEASAEELAMKKARLERQPRVAVVDLERQTEKLIKAENLGAGGKEANSWELYNNRQKATEAHGLAAMGEAYFRTKLPDYYLNKNTRRHRAVVESESIAEVSEVHDNSVTVGGKLGLEGVNGPKFRASIPQCVAVDTSESTVEVLSQVHDNSDDPDLEAGLGPIAQMVTPCASKVQLERALWMVSHASLFFGVSAGVRQPAAMGSIVARHQAAYYGLVAAILAVVPMEMATAFYLHRSNNRRFHVFAQGLRGAGVLLLITVAAVGGFALTKA